MRQIRTRLALCVLVGSLILPSCASATQQAPPTQKASDNLLLEIMDLHRQLVTNEMFLAQAKLIGTYAEAASQFEETKKIQVYSRILGMLSQIKDAAPVSATRVPERKAPGVQKAVEEKPAMRESKTAYEPGAALLEVFKADSIETMPKLPVIRTYWTRDLAYSGGFPIPDRYSEIGRNSRYVARFSFYYEAMEPGDYGFTIVHPAHRLGGRYPGACKIDVGGVEIASVKPDESSGQGVCTLKKGFHRVEFWLVSAIGNMYNPVRDRPTDHVMYEDYYFATFEVKILRPNALDAVPITKDMLLLKKE